MPSLDDTSTEEFIDIIASWNLLYNRARAGDESARRQLQAAHARLVALGDALWTPETKP